MSHLQEATSVLIGSYIDCLIKKKNVTGPDLYECADVFKQFATIISCRNMRRQNVISDVHLFKIFNLILTQNI